MKKAYIDSRWGKADSTHDPNLLANFKPRPSDILITTAPKAGTTWMQQILHQLRSGGDSNFDSIDEVVPWLELPRDGKSCSQVLEEFDQLIEPRIFKTHCTYQQTPGGVECAKIILSSRDPRDCCVSFYHHLLDFTDEARSRMGIPLPNSFDEYVNDWLNNGVWYRNIKSWWPYHDHPNLLWLRYEDMKNEFEASINQILNFLQWQLSAVQRERVLEYCSFAWMKQNVSKFAMQMNNKPVFKPGGFIRKGLIGDHKHLMTHEQEEKILAKTKVELPREALNYLEISVN